VSVTTTGVPESTEPSSVTLTTDDGALGFWMGDAVRTDIVPTPSGWALEDEPVSCSVDLERYEGCVATIRERAVRATDTSGEEVELSIGETAPFDGGILGLGWDGLAEGCAVGEDGHSSYTQVWWARL
jgi:hypothetical protein